MGEHRRQGKTFFVTIDAHMQVAIHRAPSGHFSYIIYYDGKQATGALRITQAHAADKLGLTLPELLEKFKID